MESSAPQSSTFTLRSLFVLIAIACLGLAILVPLIRKSRERQQLIQCSNNLKQIGLGIHSYHDIRQEIVPSYLTDDHSPAAAPRDFATWPILILPMLESRNFYDNVDLGTPLSAEPLRSGYNANANHAYVRSMASPVYFCPARRYPMLTCDGACAAGDYAAVSRADLEPTVVPYDPRTWDAAMLVCRVFNTGNGINTVQLGDFPPQTLGSRDFRSMNGFSSIVDGLSYTAFIGEKAVHADRLGGDPSGPAETQLPSQQDGTFYYGSGGNLANLKAPGAIAYWSRRLAPVNPQESLLPQQPRTEDPNNRFGGWHGGMTLFMMGDGSVRGVDHGVATLVLQRLGCRNDGRAYGRPPYAGVREAGGIE